MFQILLNFLLLLFVHCVNGQGANQQCKPPNSDLPGACVPLKECKVLNALLQKSFLFEDNIFLLAASSCGPIDDVSNHVCCPVMSNQRNNEPIEYRPSPCQTPKNERGFCISIRECPSLLKMLTIKPLSAAQTQFLRQSRCGSEDKVVQVCCASVKTKPDYEMLPAFDPIELLPNYKACVSPVTDKIIGGERTAIDEFPWMALIQYADVRTGNLSFNCGGSLINTRYVLTAAHCVSIENVIPDLHQPTLVRLGEWDLSTEKDCDTSVGSGEVCVSIPVQNIPIEVTIPNPDFSSADKQVKHDIALIRLVHECSYNFFVKPICLPLEDQLRHANLEGSTLTVAGWGYINNFKEKSNVKLKVNLKIVPLETCRAVYPFSDLWSKQLCAGGAAGMDSCNGDSGGPLMKDATINYHQFYYVAGIVSYGAKKCGSEGKPAIFTKVAEYLDWILDTIRP